MVPTGKPGRQKRDEEDAVIIDCDGCAMQHTTACDECIVTVLLSDMTAPAPATDDRSSLPGFGVGPLHRVEIDDEEATALERLADAGLVAPLRLVPRRRDEEAPTGSSGDDASSGDDERPRRGEEDAAAS